MTYPDTECERRTKELHDNFTKLSTTTHHLTAAILVVGEAIFTVLLEIRDGIWALARKR